MNFSKNLQQSLIKFNYIKTIRKQIITFKKSKNEKT